MKVSEQLQIIKMGRKDMSSEDEKHRMSRRIFKIELVILGIIVGLILWWQGYLFYSDAAIKRMIAVYKLRILYAQGGIWEIIKIIWWASGLIATILLYLSYVAGEIAESLLSRKNREVSSERK